nr:N-acyl homoserine lactonase family protein [Breoghania sp.]
MMNYEVYGLRYGYNMREVAENFIAPPSGMDPHDAMPMDYYIWLIRDGSRVVLVDTGFDQPAADRRDREMVRHPVDLLADMGIAAETITDVIITHLHYDHAGNLAAFPNATFHLQDREMGFATGRCMCHPVLRAPFEVEDVVEMVRRVYGGRVNFIDGDAELFPGISVHLVPGHSMGLQCVGVETARGRVVLASDASHYYANLERQSPFPIVADVFAMAESWKRVMTLADSPDHVVPGHDPLVREIYPRLAASGPLAEIVCLHEAPRARSVPAQPKA